MGNFDYTFDAYGFENDHDFGVRPVVCLDSGVLEEQVPKIEKLVVESTDSRSNNQFFLKNLENNDIKKPNERVIVEYDTGVVFDGNASELYSEDYEDVIDLFESGKTSDYRGWAKITIYYNNMPYVWEGNVDVVPV